jgi:hypothetical protein
LNLETNFIYQRELDSSINKPSLSSASTVPFNSKTENIDVNLGMMVRFLFSAMILNPVLLNTPFLREFKGRKQRLARMAPEE